MEETVIDASSERDERCKTYASELVKKIGNHPVVLSTDSTEVAKNYTSLTEDVLNYLLEKEVLFDDVNYTFRLVLEHFNLAQDFTIQSLNKSMEKATDKLWGKRGKDVSLLDMDNVLKN